MRARMPWERGTGGGWTASQATTGGIRPQLSPLDAVATSKNRIGIRGSGRPAVGWFDETNALVDAFMRRVLRSLLEVTIALMAGPTTRLIERHIAPNWRQATQAPFQVVGSAWTWHGVARFHPADL